MRKFAAAGAAGILAATLAAAAGAEETAVGGAAAAVPAALEISVSATAPAAAPATAAPGAAAAETPLFSTGASGSSAGSSGTSAVSSGNQVVSSGTYSGASAASAGDSAAAAAGTESAAAASRSSLGGAAAGGGSSLFYTVSLHGGVDTALLQGFQRAVSALMPGTQVDSSLRLAEQALSKIRIHGRELEMTFDRSRLGELLAAEGHNVWSGLKEPVLLWLADVDQNSIAGGTEAPEFARQLSTAASQNRYSLIFPLMDLDDVQAVGVQTILSHSDDLIAKASARYDAKFFVAGAVQQDTTDRAVFKWNVYDSAGRRLGGSENTGSASQNAAAAAAGIARVLMENTNPSGSSLASEKVQQKMVADVSLQPGPGRGFVRIRVTGTDNVRDFRTVVSDLVTFGYGADSRLAGYTRDGAVFEVPNSSSPAILDGTLAHSSDFTKIGDWTYRFNRSKGHSRPPRSGTGPAVFERITSQLGAPGAGGAAVPGAALPGGTAPAASRNGPVVVEAIPVTPVQSAAF